MELVDEVVFFRGHLWEIFLTIIKSVVVFVMDDEVVGAVGDLPVHVNEEF